MNIYYMPLLLVLLSLVTFTLDAKKLNTLLGLLIIVFVSLLCGLRFHSDIDYAPYLDLFNETPPINMISLKDLTYLYGEAGYLVLTSLTKYIGYDFFLITLVFSFFSISLKYFSASFFSKHAPLAISLYLCLSLITVEFIELRWSLASALVLMAYACLIHGRKAYFIFLILFASLFHYYALAFFLPPILFKSRQGSLLFLFVTTFFISLLYKQIGNSINVNMDTDIYILKRLFRYLNDPESSLGVFSYLRVWMYALAFFIIGKIEQNNLTKTQMHLIRVSLSLLIFSLLQSYVPLFFYRSMVISDLLSIVTLVILLEKVRIPHLKVAGAILVSILFCLWLHFDVNNYSNAGRILEYKSWIDYIW